MAWSFGGLTPTVQKKSLVLERVEWKIDDKYQPGSTPYFVFITDRKPNSVNLVRLQNYIKKWKITNYSILYSLRVMVYEDIKGSVTDFMMTNMSPWKELLADRKVEGVMTFGQALYQITEDADLMPEHFSSAFTMCTTYIYWPKQFGGLDCRVFPVDAIEDSLMTDSETGGGVIWRTRFFEKQMQIMTSGKFLPLSFESFEIVVADSFDSAEKILTSLLNAEELSFDLETDSLDPFLPDQNNGIICVTLASNENVGYHIDWEFIINNNEKLLCEVLMTAKVTVGSNPKFDCAWLWKKVPALRKAFYPTDAIDRLSHVIHSERPKGLKALTWIYTSLGGYENELERFKKQVKIKSYREIPHAILSKYAALDVITAMRCYHQLLKHIHLLDKKFPNEKDSRWCMFSFYKEIIMGVYPYFIDMYYDGVYVDKEKLLEAQTTLMNQQEGLIKKLKEIWDLPDDINIQSGEALGKYFLDQGWEPVEKTKKGFYTTNEDSLNVWERYNRPGIKELKELRGVSQCLKTFVGQTDFDTGESTTGWLKAIRYHEEDGSWRLHSNMNVGGAASFRMTSSKPNLQNITMRGQFAEIIKGCLTVPDKRKYKVVTIDFSSLQMRLATRDTMLNPSGIDKTLFSLYQPGGSEDAHSVTAYNVYEAPLQSHVLEVENEKGEKFLFGEKQKIKIKRNGEFVVVKAKELQSTDEVDSSSVYDFQEEHH
jgi:DNA polymerase I-like protein with 3'-5' exonuclease and polymerase domains